MYPVQYTEVNIFENTVHFLRHIGSKGCVFTCKPDFMNLKCIETFVKSLYFVVRQLKIKCFRTTQF